MTIDNCNRRWSPSSLKLEMTRLIYGGCAYDVGLPTTDFVLF